MRDRGETARLARAEQIARDLGDERRPAMTLKQDRDIESHTLAAKAEALCRMGRFADARATITEALAIVDLTQSPIKVADVNSMAGLVFIMLGESDRAAEHGRIAAHRAGSVNGTDCETSRCSRTRSSASPR
jgi:hypothetical protein